MFRKELQRRLEIIFGVPKVTLNAPDYGAPEQDCLFVDVSDARTRPHGKDRVACKIVGALVLFTQDNRTPYGFFNKRIEQADPALTKDFIFEREVSVQDTPARVQNIDERRVNFTFLFDTQYDPDRGELTELETTIEIGD